MEDSIQKTLEKVRKPAPSRRTPADRTQPVIEEIARDARSDPRRYLDEVVVPFGGE